MTGASALRVVGISLCALAMSVALAGAQAGSSQSTVLTFTAPVQLPGVVLEPGEYVFSQLVSPGGLTRVQVATARPRRVIARLAVLPLTRQADGDTVTFMRTRVGVPAALAGWFANGSRTGLQFVYTPDQRRALGDLQPVGELAAAPR